MVCACAYAYTIDSLYLSACMHACVRACVYVCVVIFFYLYKKRNVMCFAILVDVYDFWRTVEPATHYHRLHRFFRSCVMCVSACNVYFVLILTFLFPYFLFDFFSLFFLYQVLISQYYFLFISMRCSSEFIRNELNQLKSISCSDLKWKSSYKNLSLHIQWWKNRQFYLKKSSIKTTKRPN